MARKIFSGHELSRKKCPEIFPRTFLSLYLVGPKKSVKFPPKFPANFPPKKRKKNQRASAGSGNPKQVVSLQVVFDKRSSSARQTFVSIVFVFAIARQTLAKRLSKTTRLESTCLADRSAGRTKVLFDMFDMTHVKSRPTKLCWAQKSTASRLEHQFDKRHSFARPLPSGKN